VRSEKAEVRSAFPMIGSVIGGGTISWCDEVREDEVYDESKGGGVFSTDSVDSSALLTLPMLRT